jgi:hypothetical protein
MKRCIAVGLAVLTVTASGTVALARGADHRTDYPVHGHDGWPKGLKELMNVKGRVGGYMINADDYFYFSGDAKAFNAFLAQYAAIGEAHRLILHPGQGLDKRPWSKKDLKPIDWFVEVTNRAWRAIGRRKENEPPPKGYAVTVHLWVGGNVGLETLHVPLNVTVKSSGEIERFVAEHETKQSLVRKEARNRKPTTATSTKTPE